MLCNVYDQKLWLAQNGKVIVEGMPFACTFRWCLHNHEPVLN